MTVRMFRLRDELYAEKEAKKLFIVINNSTLIAYPNLIKKLEGFLFANCDFGLGFCGMGEGNEGKINCESFSCFYLEDDKQGFEQDVNSILIRLKDGKILAYCNVVMTNDGVGEIYAVCSNKSIRKGGNARILLEKMIGISDLKRFWLIVDFYNPYWDAATKLYTGLGFAKPKLINRTSDGLTLARNLQGDNRYMSLELDVNYPSTKSREDVKNLCDRLRLVALTRLEDRNINMDLKANNLGAKFESWLQPIYKNGIYQPEHGGSFTYNIISNTILIEDVKDVREGDVTKCVVEPPLTTFNFHTHPEYCYEQHNLYIGWPSSLDMKGIVGFFSIEPNVGTIAHFVITREGIYVVQLSKEFMIYMTLLQSSTCRHVFMDLISDRFLNYESFRTESYLNQMNNIADFANQTLSNYLYTLNSYTIDKLITDAKDKLKKLNKGIKEYTALKNIGSLRTDIDTNLTYLTQEKQRMFSRPEDIDITEADFEKGLRQCHESVKVMVPLVNFQDFVLFTGTFHSWKDIINNNGVFSAIIHFPIVK